MAKTVVHIDADTPTWRAWALSVIIGVGFGLLTWLVAAMITRYGVEPTVCRDVMDAVACANAVGIGGNIALVLVGVAALVLMVRLGIHRPLLIVLASIIALWDIVALVAGLGWAEGMIWTIILSVLSFAFFALVSRYARLWVGIVITIAVLLIIRLIISV